MGKRAAQAYTSPWRGRNVSNLEGHIAICKERYAHLLTELQEIHRRLDKMNGRWWTICATLILLLGGGCVSLIVYIYLGKL